MIIFKKNKLNDIEEEAIILDFLIRNKTKITYAFDLDDISKGTGIKNLTHARLSKIENVEYVELYGKIFYTYMSIEEKFQRALDRLVKKGKIKEEIKDGTKLYSYNDDLCEDCKT